LARAFVADRGVLAGVGREFGAAGVHFDLPQIQRVHRVEDEVGELVGRTQSRNPVEAAMGVAIDIYENEWP